MNASGISPGPERFHRLPEQLCHGNQVALQIQRAGFGQRQHSQVLHQIDLVQHLPVDCINGLLIGLKQAVFDGLQIAPNIGQRRSQLMGHVGGQVSPLALRLLEIFRHGIEGESQLTDLARSGGGHPLGKVPLAIAWARE